MNKMRISALAIVIIFGLVCLSVGVHAQDAAAGKTVFGKKCQSCHGADGGGNPGIAKAMNVELKPLGGAEVQSKSDADLKKVVTTGLGKMKPVAGVSDKDVSDVVAYIRTLKK